MTTDDQNRKVHLSVATTPGPMDLDMAIEQTIKHLMGPVHPQCINKDVIVFTHNHRASALFGKRVCKALETDYSTQIDSLNRTGFVQIARDDGIAATLRWMPASKENLRSTGPAKDADTLIIIDDCLAMAPSVFEDVLYMAGQPGTKVIKMLRHAFASPDEMEVVAQQMDAMDLGE